GFYSDSEFVQRMVGETIGVINAPGRRHGSPVSMSQQAVFFDGGSYSDPTNAANTFVSYYSSGLAIALGLDLTLRERYHTTLDDYMRALWRDFGSRQSAAFAPERPYTIRDLESELARLTKDSAFARDYFH